MTIQEIHEYIWNGVIHVLKSKRLNMKHNISDSSNRAYIYKAKFAIIKKMYDNGMIGHMSYNALSAYSACVLCALYNKRCYRCPLEHCTSYGEVYYAVAFKHDIEAARKIRDVDVLSGAVIKEAVVLILES